MDLYYSPLLSQKLNAEHFELSYWKDNAQSSRLAGGRGASQKINIEDKFYVLRRYLRGGLMAKFSYDKYLWLGQKNTRPYNEKLVIEYARRWQLPVPECVAYCVNHNGLFYRAAIVTEFLPNDGTLASYLDTHILTKKHWSDLAIVIKKMHQVQINHADLNADNILVHELKEGDLSFSLIDFDKAVIEKQLNNWALNNINRLHRSLLKIKPKFFTDEGWTLFIDVYQSND